MGICLGSCQQLVGTIPHEVIRQTHEALAPVLKVKVAGLPGQGDFLARH